MGKASRKKNVSKISEPGRTRLESGQIGLTSKATPPRVMLIAVLVAVVTAIVYLPALQNDFVNWDDDRYVYENPHIRSLDFPLLKWSFTDTKLMWVPLTKISHALVYALWGLNPAGHHLINILLHGLNSFLVVVLIISLIMRFYDIPHGDFSFQQSRPLYVRAAVAGSVTGLLFGLHPLHVESVAWVTERKDVLYSFFFLLSLLFYLKYTSVSKNKQRPLYYGLCLLFFSFALMSKAMAVTLPAILLILDAYPLRRFKLEEGLKSQWKLLIEKLPFFSLSLVYTIITIAAYTEQNRLEPLEKYPLAQRIYGSFHELIFYLYKMVFPAELLPLYPYPSTISFLSPEYIGSFLAAVGITAFCVYLWRKNRQVYLVVWGYYIITLLPVLGILQAGKVAGADRYTYLPSIGPFLVTGLLAAMMYEKIAGLRQWRLMLKMAGIALVIAGFISMSYITIRQIGLWKNSIVFWNYVIEKEPGKIPIAHNNLGLAYQTAGRVDKAIEHYQTTLRLNPNYTRAHNNLGTAYQAAGRIDKAIEHYQTALRLNPDFVGAHYNIGDAYQAVGQIDKAIEHYQTALRLNPDFAEVYNNLGLIYQAKSLFDRAIEHYQTALRLKPDFAEAHNNLGLIFQSKGLFDKAIEHFKIALRLKPNSAEAHKNLGIAYIRKGLKNEGIRELKAALKIRPNMTDVRQALEALTR